jgi:8-oxo-dGTP pyrophosphatase MutT (NUDIX family)
LPGRISRAAAAGGGCQAGGVERRGIHRRLAGRGVLRAGYRVAAALAYCWWSVKGSCNRGTKCALFNDGDVLLVRHTYGDRQTWDFPGGFVRRAEDPVVAARRELAEELGIDPPELSPVASVVIEIGRRSDTVFYFHGRLPDRRVAPDDVELAELAWFDPRALPRRVGEHVEQVLASLTAAPPPASGRHSPEPLASLETDPGSPARG